MAIALQDDQKLQSLLDLLCKELPPRGQVLLGATAGVRQALQDGTKDVYVFCMCLLLAPLSMTPS